MHKFHKRITILTRRRCDRGGLKTGHIKVVVRVRLLRIVCLRIFREGWKSVVIFATRSVERFFIGRSSNIQK